MWRMSSWSTAAEIPQCQEFGVISALLVTSPSRCHTTSPRHTMESTAVFADLFTSLSVLYLNMLITPDRSAEITIP